MIFTFYSYKGGVGRSMALANVSRWFQLQGLKVVMIDWDLEAPGLESFFGDAAEPASLRSRLGLLDLLVTYKGVFPSLPRPVSAPAANGREDTPVQGPSHLEQMLAIFDDALPPLSHVFVSIRGRDQDAGAGKLWLLPAGSRDETRFTRYAEMVQGFDWADFYHQYEGEAFFEWMRRQLQRPEVADVVLIDSRTGVAEMSGVCTRQLADVVVILCAPNDQNLDGVAMMANSFSRPDLFEARRQRPIHLVMVPARIDVTEGRPLDRFKERFRSKLASYLPPIFRRLGSDFDRLRIPYIREYAYAERLAVGEPDGVKAMQDAYATLATHLALLAPVDSEVSRRCRDAIQKAFGMPTALVAHLDPGDAAFASDLRQQLEAAGVLTLALAIEGEKPELAVERAVQSPGSTTPASAVVLVVSASAFADARLRTIWRQGREHGIAMYLIVLGIPSAESNPPRWLRGAPPIYLPRAAGSSLPPQLVQELQTPRQIPRVPFLAPPMPAQFFGRTEELRRVKELLFATGSVAPIALVGLGGTGKTALARAICNDEEVIDEFSDGILWASLEARADMSQTLGKLVMAFEGTTQPIVDADEAERRLAVHLATKRCLLVFDGVTEPDQIERVSSRGAGCRLLITTRARDVALKISAVEIQVGGLDAQDASRALLQEVAIDNPDPAVVKTVLEELSPSVLALVLANARLRASMQEGVSNSQLLSNLARHLQDEGLATIDAGQYDNPASSVTAALTLALERLETEDRARFPKLALLPTKEELDVGSVATALDMAPRDAEQMLRRLSALGLVAFDPNSRVVKVHGITRSFARSLQIRREKADATRVALAAGPTDFNLYLSYRRKDIAYALRIYERLTERFGSNQVFMDVQHSAATGKDFSRAAFQKFAESNAVIAVIGPRWTQGARESGNDFVSREIATCLKLGMPIIPVLVGGAPMPTPEELPAPLASLARRLPVSISDSSFNQDVDDLIKVAELVPRVSAAAAALATQQTIGEDTARSIAIATRQTIGEGTTRAIPFAILVIGLAVIGLLIAGGKSGWFSLGTIPDAASEKQDAGELTETPTGQPAPQGLTYEGALDAFKRGQDYALGRADAQVDYEKAAKLYRQSADLGYPPALDALGGLYENGLGVTRDRAEALKWYRKAAEAGLPDAGAALLRLEKQTAGGVPIPSASSKGNQYYVKAKWDTGRTDVVKCLSKVFSRELSGGGTPDEEMKRMKTRNERIVYWYSPEWAVQMSQDIMACGAEATYVAHEDSSKRPASNSKR